MRILRVNTDVLSTLDTNRQQVVSQASNAFIEFGVSELDIVRNERRFIGNRISNDFNEVTELDGAGISLVSHGILSTSSRSRRACR